MDILEKYTKIAELYQSMDDFYGTQRVLVSASELLTIIERLQQAERTVQLLVREKFESLKIPKET